MEEILFHQVEKAFQALVDQSREASLGSLANGIIHNFNGMLQILSMKLELLQSALRKENLSPSSSAWAKTEECFAQLEKLQRMIEVLSARVSSADGEQPTSVQLNKLLEEELSFLNHDLFFKHQVQLETSFSSSLPSLQGNPFDFRLGLGNLIRNGIEAMKESRLKELSVETESRDRQLRVTVRDTGCGIPKEIEPSLFQPFVTTKGGRHKGLGLFLARRVLSPYGASFRFRSGGGTTVFSVIFPL